MGVGACIIGFLNLIPLLIGLALIALGGVSQYFFGNICQQSLKLSIGYISIIIGSIILLLILINIAVQCSKNPGGCGMVMVGFTFLIILGVGGLLIWGGLKKKNVIDGTATCINDYFVKYGTTSKTAELINKLQAKLKCCGNTGPQFYSTLLASNTIPTSCCKNDDPCTLASGSLFSEGCATKMTDMISKYYPAILGLTGAVFGIMLMINCYACYRTIKAGKDYD